MFIYFWICVIVFFRDINWFESQFWRCFVLSYSLLEMNRLEFLDKEKENAFLSAFNFESVEDFKKMYLLTREDSKQENKEIMELLQGWNKVESIEEFSTQLVERIGNYYSEIYSRTNDYGYIWFDVKKNLTPIIQSMMLRSLVYEFNLLKSIHADLKVNQFIQIYLSGFIHISDFFDRFPVLLNLVNQKIKKTVVYISNVISDFERDKNELENQFKLDTKQKLTIHFSSGDPHLSGKFPLIFMIGRTKILYKPRDSHNDSLFSECVQLLNVISSNPLQTVSLLNKDTYSWSEFIENSDCISKEDIKSFYHRMGSNVALLYFLNASDIHLENLIAKESMPMLVDLECLFTNLTSDEGKTATEKINHKLAQTVLNTGVLPMYNDFFKDDISALGGHAKLFQKFHVPKLVVTEDTLEIKYQENGDQPTVSYTNLPSYKAENYRFLEYKEDVYTGFCEAFDLFLEKKEKLISLVDSYKDRIKMRHLIKSTAVYTKVLSLSYHPRFLHCPLDRQLFVFSQLIKYGDTEFLRVEVEDLLEGDIPYLYSVLNSTKVTISNKKEVMNDPPFHYFESWKRKIDMLTTQDKFYQLNILKKSFGDQNSTLKELFSYDPDQVQPKESTLTQVKIVENYINQQKVQSSHEISWLQIGYEELSTDNNFNIRLNIHPMSTNLYSGKIGLAFCYYFLWKTLEEVIYRQRYNEIMDDLVFNFDLQKEKSNGIGVFSGIGGYLYLFNTIGSSLKTKEMHQIEQEILIYLASTITEDKVLDVLGGTAGLLMLFCELYKKNPTEQNKNHIKQCVNHILDSVKRDSRGCYWESHTERKPILGFAHGTSGILYSLLKAKKTIDGLFVDDVLEEVIRFEDHYKQGNEWLDIRSENHRVQNEFYCNGLSGMMISRAAYGDEHNVNLLADSLLKKEQTAIHQDSCLCHGLFGNMWLYRSIADRLNSSKYQKLVDGHTHYLKNIRLNENCLKDDFLGVGLMTGLSGVILGLLSLEYGTIPNILLIKLSK